MHAVNLTNPREVCRKLASLHLEELANIQEIENLEEAQRGIDSERLRLSKILLAMVNDGTAIRVEVSRPGSYANTNVTLVIEDRSVAAYELKATYDLPELTADEVTEALGERPRVTAELLANAFLTDEDEREIVESIRIQDGRIVFVDDAIEAPADACAK
jgi:hypothetical protein